MNNNADETVLEVTDGVANEVAPTSNEPSVEDLATHDYMDLLPFFKEKLEEFPGSALKRVMLALIEYPLERDQVHFPYQEDTELFNLASKLMDCKFVIMRAVLDLKKEQIQAMLNETDPTKTNKEKENVETVSS